MASSTPPVVAIVVRKRSPLVTLGRPQKYRWTALNWENRKKLAISSEAYTNRADALAAGVELFADKTVDPQLLADAGIDAAAFVPSNVYLIQDGISGMQALRLTPPSG